MMNLNWPLQDCIKVPMFPFPVKSFSLIKIRFPSPHPNFRISVPIFEWKRENKSQHFFGFPKYFSSIFSLNIQIFFLECSAVQIVLLKYRCSFRIKQTKFLYEYVDLSHFLKDWRIFVNMYGTYSSFCTNKLSKILMARYFQILLIGSFLS